VKGCREGKGMRGRGRKERRGEKKRRKKRRGLKGVEDWRGPRAYL